MSNNLSFVIWATDTSKAPNFVPAGTLGSFSDGDTIELMSGAADYVKNNNLSFDAVTFQLSVSINGETPIIHSFQMENMAGNNIWLIANPVQTNPNGSFSKVFVDAFIDLPEGEHTIDVELKANDSTINTGQLTFNRVASTDEHFKISAFLDDPEGARTMASEDFMKKYASKREAIAAVKRAANYFSINLKNNNDGQAVYLIWKDLKNFSENVLLVGPKKQKTLELSNGLKYELLIYGQNQSRESALHLATVDKASDGATFSLK